MSEIIGYTRKEFVKYLESKEKYAAIEELAHIFENTDVCDDINALIEALRERDEIMSTGIGFGIAVPHAKISAVKKMAFAIGVSKEGIEFDSIDGEPVHVIIMVAAGERQHKKYLKLLSNIMSILKNEKFKETIINSVSVDDIFNIFN